MKLQKQKIKSFIISGAVSIILLGNTACVNEYFSEKNCRPYLPYDEDSQTFMLIKVRDTSEINTRDDGKFIDGSHDEHAIGSSGNYALFFDAQKKYKNIVSLISVDLSHSEFSDDNSTTNVREGVYRAPLYHVSEADYNSYWENKKGDEILGYCLVILNSRSAFETLSKITPGQSVDEVLNIVNKDTDDPNSQLGFTTVIDNSGGTDVKTGYFTMTNSAYMVNNQVQVATPFNVETLQLTEYNKYDWDKAITVYVERMLAKVTLEFNVDKSSGFSGLTVTKEGDKVKSYIFTPVNSDNQNAKINLCTGWKENTKEYVYQYVDGNQIKSGTYTGQFYDPMTEDRNWRAEITGWNMNAIQHQEYLFKKINPTGYSSFFNNWNSPTGHFRTYWAEDPYYDQRDYPWQFRKSVNIPDDIYNAGWTASSKQVPDYTSGYQNDGKNNSNQLRNFSYNTLNESNFEKAVYIPEHTYNQGTGGLNAQSLDGRRDLLAGTHLILSGVVQMADNNGSNFSAIDFYCDASGICYQSARDCVWSMVRNFNNALMSQTRMRFRQYDWSVQSNGMTLYAVPVEGQDDGGIYQVYYDGHPLTYERIFQMTEEDCRKLLAPATIKDGDGKRVLKAQGFTIQNSTGNHLPIYFLYTLTDDETYDRSRDNSGFYLGTTASRKMVDQSAYDQLKQLAANDGDKNMNIRQQIITTLGRNLASSEVTTQANNDVWSLIYEWCGAVDHFNMGRIYYATPLKTDETQDVYGSVRNTWYKYQVTDLVGIGIPVDDPDQPIVPNWDKIKTAKLNLRIGICPWESETITIPDFK